MYSTKKIKLIILKIIRYDLLIFFSFSLLYLITVFCFFFFSSSFFLSHSYCLMCKGSISILHLRVFKGYNQHRLSWIVLPLHIVFLHNELIGDDDECLQGIAGIILYHSKPLIRGCSNYHQLPSSSPRCHVHLLPSPRFHHVFR